MLLPTETTLSSLAIEGQVKGEIIIVVESDRSMMTDHFSLEMQFEQSGSSDKARDLLCNVID